MEIRLLTGRDVEAYREIRLEALQTEPRAFGESVEEHHARPHDEFEKRLDGSTENFVVAAIEDGRIVAMAGFFRDAGFKRRHRGHVWGMYVRQSHRRRGLAKTLLNVIVESARSIGGIEVIDLAVTVGQHAARELYQSCGFQIWGRERDCFRAGGESLDVDWMQLSLRK